MKRKNIEELGFIGKKDQKERPQNIASSRANKETGGQLLAEWT
jgi:hypothetical protein